jgi:hypothetical protein
MSKRYLNRVNGYLLQLITEGEKPIHKASKDLELEDGEIIIRDNISIQIDASSGDAIAVNRYYNLGNAADFYMRSWDIESDSQLIPQLKAALTFVEEKVAV